MNSRVAEDRRAWSKEAQATRNLLRVFERNNSRRVLYWLRVQAYWYRKHVTIAASRLCS